MEKIKAALSHSQQEMDVAVLFAMAGNWIRPWPFILQAPQPQGLNVLPMTKIGQTSKTIVPRKVNLQIRQLEGIARF